MTIAAIAIDEAVSSEQEAISPAATIEPPLGLSAALAAAERIAARREKAELLAAIIKGLAQMSSEELAEVVGSDTTEK